MNIQNNLAKSCLLATVIFWGVIASKSVDVDMMPFVFLSMIPIFLCVTMVIIFTVCPFFWAAKGTRFNNAKVFKIFFPFYAIVMFGLCLLGILNSDNEIQLIAFFASAFITTSQSWVWFAKHKAK